MAQIIKQGDAGDEFFIIEVGTVEISDENSSKKLTMETGKFFGAWATDNRLCCLELARALCPRLFTPPSPPPQERSR